MTSKVLAALLFVAALSACGEATRRDAAPRAEPSPVPSAEPSPVKRTADTLYEASGLVLESRKGDVDLCLGAVMDSLPPQCEGIPVEGWDWGAVSGEENAAGVTWGEFHVTGRFDGKAFTLESAGPIPSPPPQPEEDHFATPCTEPPDGWEVTDPERSSEDDVSRVAGMVHDDPDYAGLWIDHADDGRVIVNAAFTGSLDEHEAEVREVWGGALCMIERERSYKELRAIQRELGEDPRVKTLWSDVDEVEGQVLLAVVVMDDKMRAEIEERYGADAVKIIESLRPVE